VGTPSEDGKPQADLAAFAEDGDVQVGTLRVHGVEQAHGCAVAVGPADRIAFAQRFDGLAIVRPESFQQRCQRVVAEQRGGVERDLSQGAVDGAYRSRCRTTRRGTG
jgi:hypothetical protein